MANPYRSILRAIPVYEMVAARYPQGPLSPRSAIPKGRFRVRVRVRVRVVSGDAVGFVC